MTEETNAKTEETQTEEQQTEEPEKEPTQIEEVTKLLIDQPSDFKFHAAYLAYSKTWDKIDSPNTRAELNDILVSLSKDEMDYSNFYRTLDDTQRKRDWRKKQTRSQRNQRHKGKH